MNAKIMLVLLNIALELIPILLKQSKKKEQYERLIKASIYIWEKRTGVAPKLRKDHRKIDEKLNEKWKEKWGKK